MVSKASPGRWLPGRIDGGFRASEHWRATPGRSSGRVPGRRQPSASGVGARCLQTRREREAIVRSYRTLRLADVYAVISRYLADPAPFDEYLRRCDEDAAAVRREMDAAGMTGGIGNEELLERAVRKA